MCPLISTVHQPRASMTQGGNKKTLKGLYVFNASNSLAINLFFFLSKLKWPNLLGTHARSSGTLPGTPGPKSLYMAAVLKRLLRPGANNSLVLFVGPTSPLTSRHWFLTPHLSHSQKAPCLFLGSFYKTLRVCITVYILLVRNEMMGRVGKEADKKMIENGANA